MIKTILTTILLIVFATKNFAADTLIISNTPDDYNYMVIGEYLDIMEDTCNCLTISDVVNSNSFKQWKELDRFPYLKNSDYSYWVRFHIKASNNFTKRNFIFENLDQHIDKFDFYIPSNNNTSYLKKEAGYDVNFNKREFKHKNFVFQIPVNKNVNTFYIHIKSKKQNPLIFKIRPVSYFTYYALSEYIILGIYYGVLLIMLLYNLFVFIAIRKKMYIYFVVYVLSLILTALSEDGLGFQYLWPNTPQLNPILTFLSPILLIISFSLYSSSFLELNVKFKKINFYYYITLIAFLLFYIFNDLFFNIKIGFVFYLLFYVFMLFVAIKSYTKGLKQARFYIIAQSLMLVGILFLLLRWSFSATWGSKLTVYSYQIGTLIEIVLFSFALSDRIKIMSSKLQEAQKTTINQLKENQALKEKINKELEQKVSERTAELQTKNKELAKSEKELKIINSKLSEANEQLNEQATEIKSLNKRLEADNKNLLTNVKALVKARAMAQELDFEGFSQLFPDELSCKKYLYELKWKDGYKCKKCDNTKAFKGKDEYSKRCTKCGYLESATVFTIFHRLRFPIQKAFYIVFLVYANKGNINAVELSEIVDLRLNTAWSFKKKVVKRMNIRAKSNKKDTEGWSFLILD